MDKARFTKRQLKKKSGNSNRQDMEMGGESQGEEEEVRLYSSSGSKSSAKKLKLHNKSFIDPNAVIHAHVPRKLRSAMTKRSRESVSPPLSYKMKVPQKTFGTEAPEISKLKSADKVFSGPITKDEEEVAETLFSLAKMLPDDKPVEGRVDQSPDEKSKPFQDTKNTIQLAPQDPKEESPQSQITHSAAENPNPSSNSNLEGSSKPNLFAGQMIIGHPVGYGNGNVDFTPGSSHALADILRASLPSKGAMGNGVRLADPSELGVFPEFCHTTGTVQPALYNQKLVYGMWPVVNAMQKEETQRPVSGDKGNGALLACKEGLYGVQSFNNELNVPSTRPHSTKLPAWLDSATPSNRPTSTETRVLNDKVKLVDRSKRKRCLSHAYICHLIQSYQNEEKKPKCPATVGQLKLNERPMLGFNATNGLAGLNGVVPMDSTDAMNRGIPTASTNLSGCGKNPSELPICNLQEQRLQRDQPIPLSLSGIHSSEKKNCDFLSLSSGGSGAGLEPHSDIANNNGNQKGKGLVSLPQGQATYLPPMVQHHPLMAFALPHVRSSSTQSQAPQYVSNPLYYSAHPNHAELVKQQHQVWAAQLTNQHRPGGSESGTNPPRWPNGIRESTSVMPSSLAQPGFFSSPMELQSNRGSQQQQVFALSSSSVGKNDCRAGPHNCVEGGGGLQSSTSSHLQLVCSGERL